MDAKQTGELPATPAPLLRGQGTILLVEDEDMVRRPVGIYLRKLGYHVIEAANGHQALALWQEHGEKIDLLLTDMFMPGGMSGLELAERLKAGKPALQIIISSGNSPESGASSEGFVYLPKPSPSAVIASTVSACMDRKKSAKS